MGKEKVGMVVDPVSFRVFMQKEYYGYTDGEQASEPIKRKPPEELQAEGQGINRLPED